MKGIGLLLLIALMLMGCVHSGKRTEPQYSAPTGGAQVGEHVRKASVAANRAKQKVEMLKTMDKGGNTPMLADIGNDLGETVSELSLTHVALEKYKADVAHQTVLLNVALDQKNAALEKADYWHGKQVKALQELWFWRGVAGLIFLAAMGYVGWLLFKPRIF